ncbi:MAG: isoprenylcysteine carboxylmethyltransferase family protein [Myxococcota bacterium]|nr:isoprenylcysteine carboxylmethyltransferase family protein [Myxococcota bacterium]
MPRSALAICALWFLSLFVVRSVVQWRRTGSTGFKGFHGRVGSLPWIGGTSVSLGLVLALLAPLGALQGWPGGALLFSSLPVHAAGSLIAVAGTVGAHAAQLAMGSSWRVGVDETETTQLVTDGLFSWVRNPIFSFIGVSGVGLLMMVPNGLAILAGLLTAAGIEIQVRFVEEPYLERTHGERYARYAAAVGRFVPRVGRLARG